MFIMRFGHLLTAAVIDAWALIVIQFETAGAGFTHISWVGTKRAAGHPSPGLTEELGGRPARAAWRSSSFPGRCEWGAPGPNARLSISLA